MTFDDLLKRADSFRITENASQADENSIFVCIKGARADGHKFAPDAYANGCRYFVAEETLTLPEGANIATVPDTHKALASLACENQKHPSRELAVIGITGTKGKTTTAHLISHILTQNGVKCGYIGTNGIDYGDGNRTPTANTTPDAVTLQKALRKAVTSDCRAIALEVSSQALKLSRVYGTVFDTCLFTNLSPDHIGEREHPTYADYKACKLSLFTDYNSHITVCNSDDPFSETVLENTKSPKRITCSIGGKADFTADDIEPYRTETALGSRFHLIIPNGEKFSVRLPLVGRGNVSDALMAIAVCVARFGISPVSACQSLESVCLCGRSEVIPYKKKNALVVIDYAHNEVSMRNLLCNLRLYRPHRLIVLFGSVGERTESRRAELGKVSAELADEVILTSDNYGTESPEKIIRDIADGMKGFATPHKDFVDRKEAIRYALSRVEDGDILVLAGKGHERYQLIGREKVPFCEREIVLDAINCEKNA